MTTRKLVYLPIMGDGANYWARTPHIKAWGFVDGDGFTPIHTDPLCAAVPLHREVTVFDEETNRMIELAPDAEVPIEVSVALATLALAPQTLVTSE